MIKVSMKFSSKHPKEVPIRNLVSQDVSGLDTASNGKACSGLEKIPRVHLEDESNLENKLIWKPLKPKSSEDIYFAGNNIKKQKKRGKAPIVKYADSEKFAVKEAQQSFWHLERVKDLFPRPPVTQELLQTQELLEKTTKEIQYLSLEDFKVHKKRIPIEISSPEVLWEDTDFPNIKKNSTKVEKRKYVNRNKHEMQRISTSCQTDEISFTKTFDFDNFDMSIIEDLSDDLKEVFQRLLAQLKVYEELFSFVKTQK